MKKVLFVCTGNTCRSPLAEAIFKSKVDDNFYCESRGTYTREGISAAENSIEYVKNKKINLDNFKSKQITKDDISEYDYIVTMTDAHKELLVDWTNDTVNNIYTYKELLEQEGDVKDPYGQDYEEYEKIGSYFEETMDKVINKIKNLNKLYIGCDHGGFELKEFIKQYLIENTNYDILDVGTHENKRVDYPDIAFKLCDKVIKEQAKGILICGTGIGIGICANKVKGIRCAMLSDTYSARLTKEHNDSNVIALGGRVIGQELAIEIVIAWLNAKFQGGRHKKRVDKIKKYENAGETNE